MGTSLILTWNQSKCSTTRVERLMLGFTSVVLDVQEWAAFRSFSAEMDTQIFYMETVNAYSSGVAS
jgi:hypothetical protein